MFTRNYSELSSDVKGKCRAINCSQNAVVLGLRRNTQERSLTSALTMHNYHVARSCHQETPRMAYTQTHIGWRRQREWDGMMTNIIIVKSPMPVFQALRRQ